MKENELEFIGRRLVQNTHLNHNNTLFGGELMAWLDLEVFLYTMCKIGTPEDKTLVTRLCGEIIFESPARLGHIVEFGLRVIDVGTTSITIGGIARNKSTKKTICEISKMVFVCIDVKTGEKVAHGYKPK